MNVKNNEMNSKEFHHALSDFIYDTASGGAIRHLADLGFTADQIKDRLSFPTPKERVVQTMWKHFLDTGKIVLEKPEDAEYLEKVSYVQEYGEYGRPAMRRVVEKIRITPKNYICCDFGKRRYQDPEGFAKALEGLDKNDRQYILDLPWPLREVYHEADERMRRIMDGLK